MNIAPLNWRDGEGVINEERSEYITPRYREPEGPRDKYMVSEKQFTTIRRGGVNILCAPSETGKTNIAKKILLNCAAREMWHRIFIFSPTANLSIKNYRGFAPAASIVTEPTELKLCKIMLEQEKNEFLRTCIVFDDCIGADLGINGSKIFNKLGASSRHYNITVFILTQNAKQISTTIRQNAVTWYIRHIVSYTSQAVWEDIGSSIFETRREFNDFLRKYTRGYNCIRFCTPKKDRVASVSVCAVSRVIPGSNIVFNPEAPLTAAEAEASIVTEKPKRKAPPKGRRKKNP